MMFCADKGLWLDGDGTTAPALQLGDRLHLGLRIARCCRNLDKAGRVGKARGGKAQAPPESIPAPIHTDNSGPVWKYHPHRPAVE